MSEMDNPQESIGAAKSFFDRPRVARAVIPIGEGIPIGLETVYSPSLGIGGAYGTWGKAYDNQTLRAFVEQRLGRPLDSEEIMNLAELGFLSRHHIPRLSAAENRALETEVGARLLGEASRACGWDPSQVEGILIGMSGPVADDYLAEIARRAGIPDSALKVSVHKACDGSMGALHLALDPSMAATGQTNIADALKGKRVLVGGIEGLSRLLIDSRDKNALQLFGNGGGVIGIVPGRSMQFLTGKSAEVYDEEGLLEVRMFYPHARLRAPGAPLVEITQISPHSIRVAGLMHEPEDGTSVVMAGLMGMVKLFVRTGVAVVSEVVRDYQTLMSRMGTPDKSFAVAIVHHANFKINLLKEKQLQKLGIRFPMPWLLSDFGNVSAASNIIAFLRKLPSLKPGDHILFDGFGAGTYYDVLAVALGG